MGRIVDQRQLVEELEHVRGDGKQIVLTNGCFDLLHVGHIRSLTAARALGDCLVVGVNADSSVRQIKGPDRPLVPEDERAEVLAALVPVDYVVIFREPTAERLVSLVRPHVYAKGADYAAARSEDGPPPIDETRLPEATVVRRHGGQVALIPLAPGRSTTDLVRRIRTGAEPA
ncbi:MAG TPA: adenylyltransferase/cytidyltransferase family protein [Chloroflexota bacterium]|nr:adenylyltransferase/cytidyltransferase family protein [Chloroflexota bacterium]